jgi:hypothetical protein
MMMMDDLRTLYRVFVLSNYCRFPQLKAVALVGGRVSGFVFVINELMGSGNRRM